MAKSVIAGFDAGTSKFRCNLFDIYGNHKFEASEATPLKKKSDGFFYNPSDQIYNITLNILKKITKYANKNNLNIKSISFSSVGESGIPIDINGNILLDCIPWYDQRTKITKDKLKNIIDDNFIYENTGLTNDHFFSAYKILWIKKNRPLVYKNIFKWLPISDYLAWKLTGEISTDASQAMRTMLFDPKKLNWSDKIIDKIKIDKKILPKIVNAGDKKGLISEKIKKKISLRHDCLVGTGGHDDFVGTFAINGFKNDIAINSLGSAEALIINTKKFYTKKILNRSKFISGVFRTRNKTNYYIVGSILTSGIVLDWYKRLFNINNNLKINIKKSEGVKKNIFVFPQFEFSHSPINEKYSNGAILGLNLKTNKNDIYKSILECLTFDTKHALDFLFKYTNIKIKKIICFGGSVNNKQWLKIRSNILKQKLVIVNNVENVSLGSAILGALAAKIYKNENEAFSKINFKEIKIIKSNKESKFYANIYKKKYLSHLKHIIELNKIR